MGERKHNADDGEKKVVQPHREEEQSLEKKPTEALKFLSANIAQPADIQSLQKAIRNRAVTNMIQRHSRAEIRDFGFRVINRETGMPEDLYL